MDGPATEPRLAPDRHDSVLHLALGALGALQHFEEALAGETQGEPLADEDPVVLASLGLLACGRTLRRWLAESAEDLPQSPAPIAVTDTAQELLR
jgi:hypothetical protein